MNWLDVVLGGILLGSVAGGVWKGFFRLSIGLAATVVSILLASWFYGLAAAVFAPYVKEPAFANMLGFLTILTVVQIAGLLLAKLLAALTKKAGLGWLDRALGGAFGVLRGTLIAIVFVMALTAFSIRPLESAVAGSYLAPYVMDSAQILVYLTPHEIRDGFRRNYAKIKEAWKKTIQDTRQKARKELPQIYSQ